MKRVRRRRDSLLVQPLGESRTAGNILGTG